MMNRIVKIKLLVVALPAGALIVGAFQNCSPMTFNQAQQASSTTRTLTHEEQIVDTACSAGTIQTATVTLDLPDPPYIQAIGTKSATRCDWNNAGNGPMINGYFMARVEQLQTFNLPSGAKICDVKITSGPQKMNYDDHVFLALDDVLLAASHPIYQVLNQENGLSIYDWSKIYRQPWTQIPEYVYCAGQDQYGAQCSWPASQQDGQIVLGIAPQIFRSIMARDLTRSSHEFRFVTTGDNDPTTDCGHSPLKFDVQVSFSVQ